MFNKFVEWLVNSFLRYLGHFPETEAIGVRWIETGGCMADVERETHTGFVIHEYMGGNANWKGLMWTILLPDGTTTDFPKEVFLLANDGVYEYKY